MRLTDASMVSQMLLLLKYSKVIVSTATSLLLWIRNGLEDQLFPRTGMREPARKWTSVPPSDPKQHGVGFVGSGSQTGITQPLWTTYTWSARQVQGWIQTPAAAQAVGQWPFSTNTKTGENHPNG